MRVRAINLSIQFQQSNAHLIDSINVRIFMIRDSMVDLNISNIIVWYLYFRKLIASKSIKTLSHFIIEFN